MNSKQNNDLELLKSFYYKRYIIKEEDIPESYYQHQQEIALERGYCHIEVDDSMKKEMAQTIINDQKKSLDVWIEYFVSNDSNTYPMWAKYWAFQGMLQLGSYDKSKNVFNKRSKNTVLIFADLNREALAITIDYMIKFLDGIKEVDNELLNRLLENGSFSKIYTYVFTKILKEKKVIATTNLGEWIKYNQGSDYKTLVKSIEGHGTGWCTAGEETARIQLENGDFYVYYSYDLNNKPTIPRIAIRMEGNSIGEVRGVAENQNIESEI